MSDDGTGAWRTVAGGVELRVRVTPRGGRDALDGFMTLSDGAAVLALRVRALLEDGAANDVVRRLLAKALAVAPAAVTLRAGAAARLKTFRIDGDPALLSSRLAELSGAAVS